MRGRIFATHTSSVRSMVALLSLVVVVVLVSASAAVADPPGNNGTVKIDSVVFDDHPDNEPHVGCVFQVDFYGYDLGDLTADVTFEAHPPTGNAVLLTDVVAIGEDAAGGGTDLDASVTYDLSTALAAFEPHEDQGYHVKLTVNAEGSIGSDTKHKVFWVSGCEAPGTIIIEKYARPPDGTVFMFTGDLGDFEIVDVERGTGNIGSQEVFDGLQPGTYTITEIVPYGWDLIYIACEVTPADGESTFVMGATSVTIDLASDETVYCDFQNVMHTY